MLMVCVWLQSECFSWHLTLELTAEGSWRSDCGCFHHSVTVMVLCTRIKYDTIRQDESLLLAFVGVVATINFLLSKSDAPKFEFVIVVKLSISNISPGAKPCALAKVKVTVADPLVVENAFVSVVVV